MTVIDWLASRAPAPPPSLMTRITELLGDRGREPAAATHDVLVEAARDVLAGLLEQRRFGRDGALDLLVADAFMTYAFEYAAASGAPTARLEALSRRAAAILGQLDTHHA